MPSLPLSPRAAAFAAAACVLILQRGDAADSAAEVKDGRPDCGIWLGPSPIKEAEDHGWGHSVFTGRFIPEGAVVFGGGVLLEDGEESKGDGGKDGKEKRKTFGDLFVPVYDWEELDMGAYAAAIDRDEDDEDEEDEDEEDGINKAADAHSVLFQETWIGEDYPDLVLESLEGMRVYSPGLASLCPCTADGFNLEQVYSVHYRDWRDVKGEKSNDESPPSPMAGSFTYLSNAMFVASRDIQPGEELVVECEGNTDQFDPADYPPAHFQPKEAGGYSVCLDDKVEVRLADHTPNFASGGKGGGQRGLFAKRKLEKGEILTSTPAIPVHRKEMAMEDGGGKQQLLLNYMFGHPESSLMWLPQAPLITAVNHHVSYDDHEATKRQSPNAKIQWHHDKYTDAQAAGKPLSRRQQFHHAELLEMDSLEVVQKHGMGLMIDLVATGTINEGEEILIDYGKDWDDAMRSHLARWEKGIGAVKSYHLVDGELQRKNHRKDRELKKKRAAAGGAGGGGGPKEDAALHHHNQRFVENALMADPFSSYVTASAYNDLHKEEDVRTISEQHRNPYPSNIETACFFEYDWLDDVINNDPNADHVTYESWYNQYDHFDSGCLLPCIVTERREYIPGEEKDEDSSDANDDDDGDEDVKGEENDKGQSEGTDDSDQYGGSASSKRYTVKIVDAHEENTSILLQCHIYKRFEYIYMDVPREGIKFIDRPHSTDQWIEGAFRSAIGLPEEMVPHYWRDLAVRKSGMRGSAGRPRQQSKPPAKVKAPLTKEEELEEKEYQLSVKRWNAVETRRERLEETADKRSLDFSARDDL